MAYTTEDKLRAALTSKERIRTAIEEQGVSCGKDVPFSEYREKILSITGGGSGGVASGTVGPGGNIFGAVISINKVGQFVAQTVE